MPKIRWSVLLWAIPAMICLGEAIDMETGLFRSVLLSSTIMCTIFAARQDQACERIELAKESE